MSAKPVFHLYIPCLLQTLNTWYQDFEFDVITPHLSFLLRECQVSKAVQHQSLDSAFFNTLNPDCKELPVAYYRYQAQLSKNANGLACADPVYLEVAMNDVTLTHKINDLTDDEAEELITLLNQHFSQDGLKFIFGSNCCWYVSTNEGKESNESEVIESHDIDSVLMQNVIGKQAKSKQRNWQVIQNETQMLLHGSDVNRQREMAGLKPINSLWFWGAGKPQNSQCEIDKIYALKGVFSQLRGETFAKAANAEFAILPKDFTQLVGRIDNQSGRQMLLLDQLFIPAINNNLDVFQQKLEQIDREIIQPLLQEWQKQKIDIVIDSCDGNVLAPSRIPSWKFWKSPVKLRELSR